MAPSSMKRRAAPAIEEISFNPVARHEYLTGFHKRKVQRTRQAQEFAAQKAREEKREHRKKIREERAAELQRVLKDAEERVREAIGDSDSDEESRGPVEDEWQGFAEPPPVDYEAEYIDEDKYTTVTVEEMAVSREDLLAADATKYKESEEYGQDSVERADKSRKGKKPKLKKKKFRYESKAERKITARKERTGNRKKANARRER